MPKNVYYAISANNNKITFYDENFEEKIIPAYNILDYKEEFEIKDNSPLFGISIDVYDRAMNNVRTEKIDPFILNAMSNHSKEEIARSTVLKINGTFFSYEEEKATDKVDLPNTVLFVCRESAEAYVRWLSNRLPEDTTYSIINTPVAEIL